VRPRASDDAVRSPAAVIGRDAAESDRVCRNDVPVKENRVTVDGPVRRPNAVRALARASYPISGLAELAYRRTMRVCHHAAEGPRPAKLAASAVPIVKMKNAEQIKTAQYDFRTIAMLVLLFNYE